MNYFPLFMSIVTMGFGITALVVGLQSWRRLKKNPRSIEDRYAPIFLAIAALWFIASGLLFLNGIDLLSI